MGQIDSIIEKTTKELEDLKMQLAQKSIQPLEPSPIKEIEEDPFDEDFVFR